MLKKRSLAGLPARVALTYAGAAAAWIVATDVFLFRLGDTPYTSGWLSIAKGLIFVVLTGLVVYGVLRRAVSGQQRALDQLVAAERRYRERLDDLDHAYLETDAHGCVRFCNPAARLLFADAREELLGTPFAECIAGLEAHQRLDRALRCLAVGEQARGQFRARLARTGDADRELRVDWSVHPADQVPGRLTLVATEITAWARAAQQSRRLATVLEATPDLVATTDTAGAINYLNRAGQRLLGLEEADGGYGRALGSFMPAWANRLVTERAIPEATERGTWSGETALISTSGREIPVSQVVIAHRDERGRLDYLSTIARDISERKAMDQALRTSREQYRSLVENTHDGLAVARQGLVRYVNPRLSEMLGFDLQEYIGGSSMRFVHPEDRDRVRDWYRAVRDDAPRSGTIRFRFLTLSGGVRWVEGKAGTILWEGDDAILSFFTDITEKVHAEGRLEYLAAYDALTGLPNRDLFLATLADRIDRAGAVGGVLAVVYLNLTRFQIYNDSYGHELGDRLLRAVGERLSEHVADSDAVARVGGDEFVVGFSGLSGTAALPPAVRALFDAVGEPFRVKGQEFFVSASAGIAVYPDDGEAAEELLRKAASALEAAKSAGAGSYQYYAPGLNEQARQRLALETDLRHALRRGEFEVYFQPQVDLADGVLRGTEALLRWRHPERGLVMPAEFIPLLEESDLILDAGEWVFRRACEMQRYWRHELGRDLRVSVNLSARQLDDPGLVERIRGILLHTGANPRSMELEITESSLVQDPSRAADTLEALKGLGISLAVDDFGTGYSSLSYFRRFPVDTIKIDKAFIAEVTSDPDTAEIVRAIIAMGHSLGCQLVAEGVETAGQVRFLRRQQCEWMQGYYVSEPVDAARFGDLLGGAGGCLVSVTGEGEAPAVLVVSADDSLAGEVRDVLPDPAPELYTAASAEAGFETLARRDMAAVLVDRGLESMDALEFARRSSLLYPATRRALIGETSDVLLGAQVGEERAVQHFLTRVLTKEAVRQVVARAVADWPGAGTGPGRRRRP
ncbi:EAL domain-containing protein [Aquisalimonas lutea]|uniref:EAL domain-containing protein n=1 Tax=Aquisalimonas lutea TaxID=1327750 RepID=UPI0025B50D92|nr:EAL domain-containing protein [Aquisalimonas lutea]MDN3518328.1 EAL domain-containing protein [Aquisalimonas lutea]